MARLSLYLCAALTLLLPNHALAWCPKPSKASPSPKIQKRTTPPAPLLVQAGILSSLFVPFSANAAVEELTRSLGTPLEFPFMVITVSVALILGQREDQKVLQEESAAKLQKKRTSMLANEMRTALQARIQKEQSVKKTLPIPAPVQAQPKPVPVYQQPPPPQPVQAQPQPVPAYQQPPPPQPVQAQPQPVPVYQEPPPQQQQPVYQQPPPQQQQPVYQQPPPQQQQPVYQQPPPQQQQPVYQQPPPQPQPVYAPDTPRAIPQRQPTPEEEAFLRGYAQNQSQE